MSANVKLLSIIGLRSAALAAILAGRPQQANALYALADSLEAGLEVDEHMAGVAEKLKVRTADEAWWADVYGRIKADRERLHGG